VLFTNWHSSIESDRGPTVPQSDGHSGKAHDPRASALYSAIDDALESDEGLLGPLLDE
jgi:hypothetical protein